MDWSAVHLRDVGAGSALAALAYAAFSITMAIGRLAGDRLMERLGPVALARRGGLLAGVAMAALAGSSACRSSACSPTSRIGAGPLGRRSR